MAEARVEQHLQASGGERPASSALLGSLALLLVALVGLGSAVAIWDIGGPPGVANPRAYTGDLIVVGFALLATTPFVIRLLRGRKRRPFVVPTGNVPPVRKRWWTLIVVLLTLAATALACMFVLSRVPSDRTHELKKKGTPAARKTRPAVLPHGDRPPVHWWALAAVGLLVVAGAGVALRLRERLPEPEPEPEAETDLLEAVDLSLDDLEHEPDPRRAVIRAYGRMEDALGRHGLARRSPETPFEYLARALTSLRVGRASVERLTALFERAKFSPHTIDLSMKADALTALAALRDELSEAAT